MPDLRVVHTGSAILAHGAGLVGCLHGGFSSSRDGEDDFFDTSWA
jgi:hypothetical protein